MIAHHEGEVLPGAVGLRHAVVGRCPVGFVGGYGVVIFLQILAAVVYHRGGLAPQALVDAGREALLGVVGGVQGGIEGQGAGSVAGSGLLQVYALCDEPVARHHVAQRGGEQVVASFLQGNVHPGLAVGEVEAVDQLCAVLQLEVVALGIVVLRQHGVVVPAAGDDDVGAMPGHAAVPVAPVVPVAGASACPRGLLAVHVDGADVEVDLLFSVRDGVGAVCFLGGRAIEAQAVDAVLLFGKH